MTGAFVFLSTPRKPQHHMVTLTWHAPAPSAGANVVLFNIYRSTNPDGPFAKVGSSKTGLVYRDEIVNPGVTYYYLIKSVDKTGRESTPSEKITVAIPSP